MPQLQPSSGPANSLPDRPLSKHKHVKLAKSASKLPTTHSIQLIKLKTNVTTRSAGSWKSLLVVQALGLGRQEPHTGRGAMTRTTDAGAWGTVGHEHVRWGIGVCME